MFHPDSRPDRNLLKRMLACLCILPFAISLAAAQDEQATQPIAARPLTEKIQFEVGIRWEAEPLSDILQQIQTKHQLLVVIDNAEISKSDVNLSQRVTFDLPRMRSIRSTLWLILEPRELGWAISNDQLLVTTATKAAAILDRRTYSTKELGRLGQAANAESGSGFDLRSAIVDSIDPKSWKEKSRMATIDWTPDGLVVQQTEAVHQQIDDLISDLKTCIAGMPPRATLAEVTQFERFLDDQTNFAFENLDLPEALDYFSQLYRIPVVLDEDEIRIWNIDPHSPLSMTFRNTSVRAAFDQMLDPMGLDYTLHHGVMLVTSRGKAADLMMTRVYDVRRHISKSLSLERLIDQIRDQADVKSWQQNGGPARLVDLGGVLIITQSHRGHRQIAAYLNLEHAIANENNPEP